MARASRTLPSAVSIRNPLAAHFNQDREDVSLDALGRIRGEGIRERLEGLLAARGPAEGVDGRAPDLLGTVVEKPGKQAVLGFLEGVDVDRGHRELAEFLIGGRARAVEKEAVHLGGGRRIRFQVRPQ